MMFSQFNVMVYVVEMNEWGCWLYDGVGNLLTFVAFSDKTQGAGYSPENMVIVYF